MSLAKVERGRRSYGGKWGGLVPFRFGGVSVPAVVFRGPGPARGVSPCRAHRGGAGAATPGTGSALPFRPCRGPVRPGTPLLALNEPA